MKIIKPSARIIEDELAALSICQRMDRCASICYQRPPKSTEEEAQAFCKKYGVDAGHGMMLEMARFHLVVENAVWNDLENLQVKYLDISALYDNSLIVSGSIRAFREWFDCEPDLYGDAMAGMSLYLTTNMPLFFDNQNSLSTDDVSCTVREAFEHEIPWQHKYVAAHFIVNRAVSHELVRHRPCSILQESQRYCDYDRLTFIEPKWLEKFPKAMGGFKANCREADGCYTIYREYGLSPQEARFCLPNSTKTELIIYASLPEWKHIFKLRTSPRADPEMLRVMIPLGIEFELKYPEAEWGK